MSDFLRQIGGGLGGLGGLGDKISEALGGQAKGDAPAQGTNPLGSVLQSAGGLGGLLGSAALGGLLGTLLSGKTARKVAQGALAVGGTAAVGALAWKFYQKWSEGNAAQPQASTQSQASTPSGWPEALQSGTPQPETQAAQTPARATDQTALLLLEAMVFAARADGHIDNKERDNIRNAVESLFPGQDMGPVLETLLDKPLDPSALAARITNHDEARDLYRISAMIIDADHFMERSYLEGLAAALAIPAPERAGLDADVAAAKANGQA